MQANWAAPAYYTGMILAVAIFDKKYKEASVEKQRKKIALYSWSSILVTALLILIIHNPEYLTRINIPVKAKYDVTSRLRGWQDLGNEVSKTKTEMLNEIGKTPVFIFSDSYQIASELAFYVSGQPETYCINLGRRMNQYDLWGGWDKLIGWDAIYVIESKDGITDPVSKSFSNCAIVKKVPIYLYNEKIREFSIYKCYNFKGLINPTPTSY